MGEILEKMLLLALGITMIIIFAPIINSINLYFESKIMPKKSTEEVIESDLKSLKESIDKGNNITRNFSFNGTIIVVQDQKNKTHIDLNFRFEKEKNKVRYSHIIVSNNIEIQIIKIV